MTQKYPAQDIPATLARLIEAWHAHREAVQQLEEYRRANPPPPVPDGPLSVDALQAYHSRRMTYEAGLEEANGKVEATRGHLAELETEVQLFLPRGPRLLYEYQGARENVAGRYIIQHRLGRLTIRPHEAGPRMLPHHYGRRP